MIELSNFTNQSSMVAGEIPSQKAAVPTKPIKGVTSKGPQPYVIPKQNTAPRNATPKQTKDLPRQMNSQ